MRKVLIAALLCLLPSVVGAQSINYYPPAGGVTVHTKALTEASNTEVIRVTVPLNQVVSFKVLWTAFATDGTEYQAVGNSNTVTAVNKPVTGIAVATGTDGGDVNPVSAGTFSCSESIGAGATYIYFQLSCTSSLAQTTLNAYAVVLPNVPASLTVVVP